jgi:hypothetical protein
LCCLAALDQPCGNGPCACSSKPWYAGRKPTRSLNKPRHNRNSRSRRYFHQRNRAAARRSFLADVRKASVLINLRSAAPASPITSCRALHCEVHIEIRPSERQDPAIKFILRRVQRADRRELPAGRHDKPHLLRLWMLRRAPGWCGRDNSRLCEGIMITTSGVWGPNRVANPCHLTLRISLAERDAKDPTKIGRAGFNDRHKRARCQVRQPL